MTEAMKPGAPVIYDEWGDNKQVHLKFDFGDPQAAFKEADKVIKVPYREGRASAFPLEARGFIADYNKHNTGDIISKAINYINNNYKTHFVNHL